MDKGEESREYLRKQAEKRAAEIDNWEQKIISKGVETLDERYEKSFDKIMARCDKKSVLKFVNYEENYLIKDVPIDYVIKNNINDVLEIVKNSDYSCYEKMVKYQDNISVAIKYVDLFLCEAYVTSSAMSAFTKAHIGFTGYGSRYTIKPVEIDTINCNTEFNKVLKFNNKYKIERINLEQVENDKNVLNLIKSSSIKYFPDIYEDIKKEIFKAVKTDVKKLNLNSRNLSITDISLRKLSLKHILYPIAFVRCSKPGIDIKLTLDANKCVVL